MKRSLVGVLLAFVALIAMVAWLVAYRQNQLLQSELAAQRDAVAQTEAMVDHQRQLLGDARLGNALLCRMALSKDHDEILKFVRAIPAESLSCKTMELPEYAPLELVWFHYDRQLPDGSLLPTDKCKSAALLLNSESLEIVDYDLHDGFCSVSKYSVEPYYVSCRDSPDGTSVNYIVLPTGFETQN
ncbi:MAG: hypothetical protein OSA88_10310 [Acidimicrobiales bacterium]|nr:hypothetical protein [Acidimicrobiales bacterium]